MHINKMSALKSIVKLTLFSIAATIIALVYLPVLIILFPWQRMIGPYLLQFSAKACLRILKVKIVQSDIIDFSAIKGKGIILLSNHVNLLDIFLLAALYRSVFVSKVEIKYYPLFGQIAWLLGTIFLKRSSIKDRHRLIRTIADKAQDRIITIFPQGTTSTFTDPVPFKRGIFKTVELNQNTVLIPITIHYKEEEKIIWTDDQSLLENVKNICAYNQIHVKIKIHREISIEDYRDRSIPEVCRIAQKRVLSPLWTD